jgi:hypothetical protein
MVSRERIIVAARCVAVATILLSGLTAARTDGSSADRTGIWQPWQHVLLSEATYANPNTDVSVRVRLEGPRGAVRTCLGFWDGDRRFVIRAVFPTAGRWTWSTTCSNPSDRGLYGKVGQVEVQPAAGTNPLRRHGYLRVSEDGRLLVHADGTPFLWIGDTCWAAPVHATEQEWRQYVANRAAKGYSVLQLSVAPDWALEHSRRGIAPFLSKMPDITMPNPQYFQDLDRKLAIANDSGLVVMMVGLMETPYRYPRPEQVAVLSRYVAARCGSFAVIFSPSFDSGIREAETLAAARAIREASPASLITMHMGTGVGPRFHGAEWLSFDMFQSGHNGGDRVSQSVRAVGMPAEILALSPRKPIVNGEAIYEGDLGCAYDVRRTAWLSFLSGAVGYTAGINELYQWEPDALAKMDLPSSDQVSLLGRILRALPWWKLEPAPNRILNQPSDRSRLMALAMTSDRRLAMAYLPDNEALEADLTGCAPECDVLWISPVDGRWQDGKRLLSSERCRLVPPDRRDWVALLTVPDSTAPQSVKRALSRMPHAMPGAVATLTFGPNAAFAGLVLKTPSDGVLAPCVQEGVPCMANETPARNKYLYVDVDDRLAFRGNVRRMQVEVRVQTRASADGIVLQYDAAGSRETANVYRAVLPTSVKQVGPWTILSYECDQPYLGGRQNAGADFRLSFDGRLCRIASVKVALRR